MLRRRTGRQAAPLGRPVHVRVQLERDESGYPPFEAEELDAVELGGGLLRLTTAPTFAHGLANGDVVRAVEWEDALWVDALHEPSGRSVIRVVGLGSGSTADAEALVRERGCDVRAGQLGLAVVDLPPEVPVQAVADALEPGRRDGLWDYDVGVDAWPAG